MRLENAWHEFHVILNFNNLISNLKFETHTMNLPSNENRILIHMKSQMNKLLYAFSKNQCSLG